MPLPINIPKLLKGRIIEHDRIEFKEGWNPDGIYLSICAFANDFENIGGGYIIIGVKEENGIAQFPVIVIPDEQIDTIQRQMIGFNNLIKPVYSPKLSIEKIDNKNIIVLWILGGANRPYEVPEQITAKEKRFFYYIRKYSSSVKANQQEQQELIGLANQVPFDDRVNTNATIDDISSTLIRDHLRITKSRLHEFSESLSKAESLRIWNYPLEALEEAIANAIYHRDYQVREPFEILIYTDFITILNYCGPNLSIKQDAFKIGPIKPRRYRNRRLGDFLKKLDLTEGKATGIPRIKKVMNENGSPEAFFDFDDDRTFFEVDFFIHPEFKTEKYTLSKSLEHLNERALQIISLIKSNPEITAAEISDQLVISKRSVEKYLSKFKALGILDRIGSDKSGRWLMIS